MYPRRQPPAPAPKHKLITARKIVIALALALVVAVGGSYVRHRNAVAPAASAPSSKSSNSAQTEVKANHCASNALANFVLVSISSQHLWACAGSSQVYDSAVITGMELYPADLTPPGTYKIYAKQTNQTLIGSDNTGSWSDPVSYWMPFLYNQYGAYGFHDATWRALSDFGHVNINAPYTATLHGSHGCVELPLATAKWLYNWAPVGTTVTIES